MSDRKNFFFDQEVTEQELDSAFDQLEAADQALARDLGFKGLKYQSFGIHETIPPSFNVRVAGDAATVYDPNEPPGIGYSKLGKRLYGDAAVDVDVLTDENNQPISIPSPGNVRWVSVFVAHNYAESDPREDGNNNIVNFQKTETAKYNVVAADEDILASATKPPLRSDEILAADILLSNGIGSIVQGFIYYDRREEFISPDAGAQVQAGELHLGRLRLREHENLHTVVPLGKATNEALIKAWCKFTAAGVYKTGYNIAEVTRLAAGQYVVKTYEELFFVGITEVAIIPATGSETILGTSLIAQVAGVTISNGAVIVDLWSIHHTSSVLYDADMSVLILHKDSV